MTQLQRDLWSVTLRQVPRHPITAARNARFLIAMRLGGFTSATRAKRAA